MVIQLLISFHFVVSYLVRSYLVRSYLVRSYLVSVIISLLGCVVWCLAILLAKVLSLNLFFGGGAK